MQPEGWMPYEDTVPMVCCWEYCPDRGVVRKADFHLASPYVGDGVVAMLPVHCASCGMAMIRQKYLTRQEQAARAEDS